MRTSPPSHFFFRESGPSCKDSNTVWPSSPDTRRRGWKGTIALLALLLLVGKIYSADIAVNCDGGKTTYSAVDVSAVTNPAPQNVNLTNHYVISGTETQFSYSFPSLTVGSSYLVRLHFAETSSNGPGIRVFNVAINGAQVLSNFDIYASAGGKNKAIVALRYFSRSSMINSLDRRTKP